MGAKQSVVNDQRLFKSYLKDPSKLNDLSGKVVAITGTSPGSIGYYIAEAAAAKNAKLVLLLNRESERSALAEKSLKEGSSSGAIIQTVPIDLLSLTSVKQAADKINEIAVSNGGLDVLCCNAGIMAMNDDRTDDGYNVEIQADHLSHYLLTKECMGSMEAAVSSRGEARVVYQSSSARFGDVLEQKYFEKSEPMTLGGNGNVAYTRYHQAKLANSAFAMALADKLKEHSSKVKSVGCEPGYATSGLASSSKNTGWMVVAALNCAHLLGGSQSSADGSLSACVASFGPNVESGDFICPSGRFGFEGPPGKTISAGKEVKKGAEKATVNPISKKLIMTVSEAELGSIFGE